MSGDVFARNRGGDWCGCGRHLVARAVVLDMRDAPILVCEPCHSVIDDLNGRYGLAAVLDYLGRLGAL